MSEEIQFANKEVKTLGFKINVKVPATVEGFDKLAGRSGAALDSAILNVIYRSVLATFRDLFTEKLGQTYSIARKTKETGKHRTIKGVDGAADTQEAIVVWDETEAEFFDRIVAHIMTTDGKTEDEVMALLSPVASEVASGITFDPSESAPSSAGPKKVAKQYLETAQTIIDKGGAEKVAAKLGAILNRVVATDLQSLAYAISEDQAIKRKALAAEYAA